MQNHAEKENCLCILYSDVKAKFNLQFGNAMAAKIFKMKMI